MCKARLSSFLLLALTPALAGQIRFSQFEKDTVPPAVAATEAVAVGDLDGDGRPDLVFGNRDYGFSHPHAFRNVGNGKFEDRSAAWILPRYDEPTHDVKLADLDADGDLDLVLGNHQEKSRIYLNDGTGVLTDVTASHLGDVDEYVEAVEVFDADGDGDLDIAFAISRGDSQLFRNDGQAVFTSVAGAFTPSSFAFMDLAAGDVDGDGDLDLVGAMFVFPNELFLNDGTGLFTQVVSPPFSIRPNTTSAAVELGDVDADGDLDVVFATSASLSSLQNELFLNDGRGNFTDVSATHLPPDEDESRAVQLADLDADGDPDLVFGNEGADTVYMNDGSGVFGDVSAATMDAAVASTAGFALADLDGDGDLDAALAVGTQRYLGRNVVLYNEGGVFYDASRVFLPSGGIHGETGDVNGDGILDVVHMRDELSIMFGDRGHRFGKTVELPLGLEYPYRFRLVDVDADNDLDILAANAYLNPTPELFLNDGSGDFADVTATHVPPSFSRTDAIAVGDLDGDGDPDAVFSTLVGGATLLNDGSGVFTSGPTFVGLGQSTTIDLADIDGDGDLDVAVGTWLRFPSGGVQLFINDGAANFSLRATLEPLWRTDFVLFDDVDRDGDPDLWTEGPRLYVNGGEGEFTRRNLPVAFNQNNLGVRPGDFDGDGDSDVVLWDSRGSMSVWENDGAGFFSVHPGTGLESLQGAPTIVDIEGDGDVDVFFPPVTGSPPARLFQNVRQHLSAPYMAKLGQAYRLTVHAHGGLAAMVFVDVRLAPTPLPTPFGTLHLDLGTALQTPVLTMSGTTLDLDLVMPAVPALAGFALYSQAIVVSGALGFRWTNLLGDFIFS